MDAQEKPTTIEELIQKGVETYNARIEAQRRARAKKDARLEAERAEARQAVIALFPVSLHSFITVSLPSGKPTYAKVRIILPSGGEIAAYAEKTSEGWVIYTDDDYYRSLRRRITVYECKDPRGYSDHFFSIEEAVAYAMGAINV